MGLLVAPFMVLIAFFSLMLSYDYTLNEIKTKNLLSEFQIDANEWTVRTVPTADRISPTGQLEEALVRYCQFAQAMIIRCQECYASGRTYCPYPTDAFCQSAKGANYNDYNLDWGFLPNSKGYLTDLYSLPNMSINNLTNISQIPLGIRWLFIRTFSQAEVSGFIYLKPPPPPAGADVCGVEGIITQ